MLQLAPTESHLLDGFFCSHLARINAYFVAHWETPLLYYSHSLGVTSELSISEDDAKEILQAEQVGTHQLTVSTPALNLEKLISIQKAFEGSVEIFGFHIGYARSSSGVVAKAKVIVTTTDNINAIIDKVSFENQVDIALIENAPKLAQPGLVVFDMDSTLIQMECIDEIAKLADVGDKVAEVTELAMQGKLDFAESLHNRVACIEGVDVTLLQGIRDRIPLMPGITKLIWTLQQCGWKVAIASGGFTFFANYLADRLNLDFAVSNQLEIEDGKLTGKVLGDVVDAQKKADTLLALQTQFGIDDSQTLAVGDGANDLIMMSKAALGVAFRAKPVVRQQAAAAVTVGGLDTILDFLE